MSRNWLVVALCLVGVGLVGGLDAVASTRDGSAGSARRVGPGRFTSTIDNPFLPLRPGTRWVYAIAGPDGAVRRAVEVTSDTRLVRGVPCVVVRDTVSAEQQVVADTVDWYAQDVAGNVWSFGAQARQFRAGKVVGTAGSWEAGVRGAEPGVVMKADPRLGDSYPEASDNGPAEHMAQVVSLNQEVMVPFGFLTGVRVIKSYPPPRPGIVEHRFYARGVGLVLSVTVEGGPGHAELVEMTRH
jgi:hypothetical protein